MSQVKTRHPGGCASRKSRPPEKRNCRKLSQKGIIPGGNEIYLLIDSALYFLEHVFIHCQDRGFRLVVIHDNQVYHNNEYKTPREAQAAFLEHFRQRAWKEGIKPDWSCKYKVDRSWLRDKYRLIASSGDKTKQSCRGTKKSPFFGRSIQKTPRGVAGPGAVFTNNDIAPEMGLATPTYYGPAGHPAAHLIVRGLATPTYYGPVGHLAAHLIVRRRHR